MANSKRTRATPTKTTEDRIAERTMQHELRHCFAAATAFHILGDGASQQKSPADLRKEYDSIFCHIHVRKRHGEFSVYKGNYDVTDPLFRKMQELCALGPVAKNADPLALIRKSDTDLLREEGNLSDRDIELAEAYDGPPTHPIIAILGAKYIEERLGIFRFRELGKHISVISNQSLPDLRLRTIVPFSISKFAYEDARKQIQDALSSSIPKFGYEKHLERDKAKTSRPKTLAEFTEEDWNNV